MTITTVNADWIGIAAGLVQRQIAAGAQVDDLQGAVERLAERLRGEDPALVSQLPWPVDCTECGVALAADPVSALCTSCATWLSEAGIRVGSPDGDERWLAIETDHGRGGQGPTLPITVTIGGHTSPPLVVTGTAAEVRDLFKSYARAVESLIRDEEDNLVVERSVRPSTD